MQSSKLQKGNMITSRFEKQLFIAPGALGKGRGKGLRPSLRSSSRDALIGAINNSTSPNDTSTEQPNDASLPCEFESVEDIQSAEETTECGKISLYLGIFILFHTFVSIKLLYIYMFKLFYVIFV